MKPLTAAIVFGTTFLCGAAYADVHRLGYVDSARVVWAEPIYETVEVSRPVRECWTERVVRRGRRQNSYTGAIAGGIIGGVLGNRIGRGDGRTVLTVAGSLLGASIGHDLSARPGRPRISRKERCEIVEHYDEEEQIVGYRVKYRYKGKTFFTRTREHPGRRIRVRVNVDPVE